MSMKTDIIYGYGVDSSNLEKIKTEKLVEFFKNHLPDNYKQMCDKVMDITNVEDIEEWLDEFECCSSGIKGRYAIISTAMTKETNMRFAYHYDSVETGESAVMFEQTLPWLYTKAESSRTQEDMAELFKKYFREVGIEVEPDTVSIEYYG